MTTEATTTAPAAGTTTLTGAAQAAETPPVAVTTETKPAETPAPAAAAPPAKLELKWPEGKTPAPEQAAAFEKLALEAGIDSKKAQSLVDFYQGLQTSQAKAQEAAFESTRAEWAKALKADAEVAGKTPVEFAKNITLAQRAVAQFGGAELKEALEATGLGDHPALVRAFARIGKALGEDSLAGSSAAPAGKSGEEAHLRALYPTMFKE